MSFMDSLFGLFSGCYDNLEFNIHLWFLPCFFVTVIFFNILINLGGRRMAYLVSALMSLAFLLWFQCMDLFGALIVYSST